MNNKIKRSLALLNGLEKNLPPTKAKEAFLDIAQRVLANHFVRKNAAPHRLHPRCRRSQSN